MRAFATPLLMILGLSFFAGANDLPVPPPSTKQIESPKLSAQERAELLALKIFAGSVIRIHTYDPKTRTFNVKIVEEPEVGPNTTTFENLKRAMGEPTAARRMGNPQDWLGREMTLVQDLILLSDTPATSPKKKPAPATRPGKSR